ncbi:50S ribosomal protein L3 [bacterium]|nr:50S ribosomal protein L3 [bacterium]
MKTGVIGKKVGMTHIFVKNEENNSVQQIPVTVIKVEPNFVLQIKDTKKDGYNAIQLGALKNKWYRGTKPVLLHVMTALGMSKEDIEKEIKKRISEKIFTFQILKEFKLDDVSQYNIGDSVDVSQFQKGDIVNVIGKSKGKGFQGVMKRHNFHGGPATHGSHLHRAPGSIGMCAWPSRVLPGKKMPGRMGSDKITVKKIPIIDVIPEKNVILVKGGIPGPTNAVVYIQK